MSNHVEERFTIWFYPSSDEARISLFAKYGSFPYRCFIGATVVDVFNFFAEGNDRYARWYSIAPGVNQYNFSEAIPVEQWMKEHENG